VRHLPYARDVLENFDYYFSSVEPVLIDAMVSVDFSKKGMHSVSGFDHFPLLLPSLPEPVSTIEQYIDLTSMKLGDVVIDLGAYSGLSSILFQETVGSSGRVIAVEADHGNFQCSKINFSSFQKVFGFAPEITHAAIWDTNGTLTFSQENNLGSAVSSLLPRARKENLVSVKSLTLSEVCRNFGLEKVDVIKADVEGAEYQAFSDKTFFEKFHPVIIFEPAEESLHSTRLPQILKLLTNYGYKSEVHAQLGSKLPLVVCK
jgi:FkbM family methyltransferase